jgi:hypothetical protein
MTTATKAPHTKTTESEPNSGMNTPMMYTSMVCKGVPSAIALFVDSWPE